MTEREWLFFGLSLAAAFFSGAIPMSYILVKMKTGKDIRTMGSGNPGATNVFRNLGFKEGLIVLLLDFLKGALPVFFLPLLVPGVLDSLEMTRFLLTFAAILGHVFSPFLGFRGGKGVAVGAGGAFAMFPFIFAGALGGWLLLLRIIGYMSLASIFSAYIFALGVLISTPSRPVEILAFLAAIFITWTHRANLRRLLKGQEPRFKIQK